MALCKIRAFFVAGTAEITDDGALTVEDGFVSHVGLPLHPTDHIAVIVAIEVDQHTGPFATTLSLRDPAGAEAFHQRTLDHVEQNPVTYRWVHQLPAHNLTEIGTYRAVLYVGQEPVDSLTFEAVPSATTIPTGHPHWQN